MSLKSPSLSDDDLPFMSVSASEIFPGRYTLYLWEVAKVLSVSTKHVGELIEEGKLAGVNISGKEIEKRRHCAAARRYWRVPVSAFENFIKTNKSL